ncbi:MAG: RES family NAD+ phosphorylase [Rhodothermales bacterium]
MTVWRITHERYQADAFSGLGAERYGGRFNSPGHRLVYTASSISLALLELLVQANSRERLKQHVCIPATFDGEWVEQPSVDALPAGWNARPYGRASQAFGDQWLREQRSLVLSVPSIVNPYERNCLINPAHPYFGRIELGEPVPAPFDSRLARQ